MAEFSETVKFTCTPEMKSRLEEWAEFEDESLSTVVREIVKHGMRDGGIMDPEFQLQQVQRQIADLEELHSELERIVEERDERRPRDDSPLTRPHQ